MQSEPRWITLEDAIEANEEQIGAFGGPHGLKDMGLVESAVMKPQMTFHYGRYDLLALAVGLGVAIARNHGFVDGNKRTGLVLMLQFLAENGYLVDAPDNTMLGEWLVAVLVREMTEEEMADRLWNFLIPWEA